MNPAVEVSPLLLLARAAAAGDAQATARLVKELAPRIMRTVHTLMGSSHQDVDDDSTFVTISPPVVPPGGAIAKATTGRGRLEPALCLVGEYHVAFDVPGDLVSVHSQVLSLRLLPTLRVASGRSWLVEAGFGGGTDVFFTSPRLNDLPAARLSAGHTDLTPVLTAMIAGHLAVARSTDLVLAMTLDGDLAPHRCNSDGRQSPLSAHGCECRRCRPRPIFCDGSGPPVCGCDDVSYWNDCLRKISGTSASVAGECASGAKCGGPTAQACPTSGASCARLLPGGGRGPGPGAGMCPADAEGTCWVLPPSCPTPDPEAAAWELCSDHRSCADVCTAIRAEVPYRRLRGPKCH